MFDEADAALGESLSRLCFEGPEDRLVLTENTQRLLDIADALLAREILDADQVRRLAYGHPLDDAPAAEAPGSEPAVDKPRDKGLPSLVPPIEPIRKPLTQE